MGAARSPNSSGHPQWLHATVAEHAARIQTIEEGVSNLAARVDEGFVRVEGGFESIRAAIQERTGTNWTAWGVIMAAITIAVTVLLAIGGLIAAGLTERLSATEENVSLSMRMLNSTQQDAAYLRGRFESMQSVLDGAVRVGHENEINHASLSASVHPLFGRLDRMRDDYIRGDDDLDGRLQREMRDLLATLTERLNALDARMDREVAVLERELKGRP